MLKEPMNAWQKAARIARLAPSKPWEIADRIAHVVESRWDQLRSRPGQYKTIPFTEALAEIGKFLPHPIDTSELARVDGFIDEQFARLPKEEFITRRHCAGRALGQMTYLVTRARRPRHIVETGVAYGVTTSYALCGLDQNNDGTLSSVDLPPLGDEDGRFIGALVPASVASRWKLHRGSSRAVLPRLLATLGEIDIFVHDSLHTFRTMTREFEQAWERLSATGVLLSDDIGYNDAFAKFLERTNPKFSCAFASDEGEGCFGIAIKR